MSSHIASSFPTFGSSGRRLSLFPPFFVQLSQIVVYGHRRSVPPDDDDNNVTATIMTMMILMMVMWKMMIMRMMMTMMMMMHPCLPVCVCQGSRCSKWRLADHVSRTTMSFNLFVSTHQPSCTIFQKAQTRCSQESSAELSQASLTTLNQHPLKVQLKSSTQNTKRNLFAVGDVL